MKKIICALFIIGLGVFASAAWESVGPFGGPLNTVVIAPSDEDVIYAAMATFAMDAPIMIFKSIDGGGTWQKINAPPMVSSIAIDPFNPDIIYAGSAAAAVFKSTDGGENWIYNYVSNALMINDVAVHATNTSIIYAVGVISSSGNKMGFFRSTDSGVNWTPTVLYPASDGEAHALAIDPLQPSVIYVGGVAANVPKIYKTVNGGLSFSDVTGNLDPTGGFVRCLAVNTGNSNTVYATTYNKGIHRTNSGGTSWTLVKTEDSLTTLATTQAASNIVYAGKDLLILKSTDAGINWFDPGAGYGGEAYFARGIAISNIDASVLHTVCRQGFFTSTNSGSNWYESNQGICMIKVVDVESAPSNPSVIYTSTDIGSKDGPIYRSNDSASSWSMVATPIPTTGSCGIICELAVHSTDPACVYALEGSG